MIKNFSGDISRRPWGPGARAKIANRGISGLQFMLQHYLHFDPCAANRIMEINRNI